MDDAYPQNMLFQLISKPPPRIYKKGEMAKYIYNQTGLKRARYVFYKF